MEIEKYYNSDKTAIAVLVSPDYGAGWSTWNTPEIAYDRRVVEYWSEYWLDKIPDERYMDIYDSQEVQDFMESIGYDNIYCGGWGDIRVAWVPVGTLFRINEYDGSESLEILREDSYIRA